MDLKKLSQLLPQEILYKIYKEYCIRFIQKWYRKEMMKLKYFNTRGSTKIYSQKSFMLRDITYYYNEEKESLNNWINFSLLKLPETDSEYLSNHLIQSNKNTILLKWIRNNYSEEMLEYVGI